MVADGIYILFVICEKEKGDISKSSIVVSDFDEVATLFYERY